MDKYILLKGNCIGKEGLPGGKLDAKTKDLEIEDKYLEIIRPSLHHFIDAGRVVKVVGKEDAKKTVEEKPKKISNEEGDKKPESKAKK